MGRLRRGQLQSPEPKITDDPQSPDRPEYPRRYPRLGNQFQTKFPKGKEPLDRLPPDLMSTEYPHVTEKESKSENDYIKGGVEDSSLVSGRRKEAAKVPRGGLLVHKPSQAMNRFSGFVQPLVLSLPDVTPNDLTNDDWRQHMIQIHNRESPEKGRRVRRGGIKRKRAQNDEESFVWSLENVLKRQNTRNMQSSSLLGEDQGHTFEYLRVQHDGNVDAAELNVLVKLSAGKASKTRKCLETKRMAKRKLPPLSSSESWRIVYEQTGFASILGNFQDDTHNNYLIEMESNPVSDFAGVGISYDRDDLKGAWRSVLACGKLIERQLDATSPRSKKLLLSTVVSFVSNAYRLPIPETCFGSHHVMIEEVSNCLLAILRHVDNAKEVQATIKDKLFDERGEGIDSDSLQKYIEAQSKCLAVKLDEVDHLSTSREVILEWENRLSSLLDQEDCDFSDENRDDFEIAGRMALEAKAHGYISKGLVQLNTRALKAKQLRERVIEWRRACDEGEKCTTRATSALVKEAKRLKFVFPEVTYLVNFHKMMEDWIDRANIGIRSRISLKEIKLLKKRGEEIPLDLSEYINKLNSRISGAEEWLSDMEQVVPCPTTDNGEQDMLRWSIDMRQALNEDKSADLHELAMDGSRIPVDVDAVKLLQVELDAKSWAQKARRWLPLNDDGKPGKLDDIRDHVVKGSTLRERLTLCDTQKGEWVLEGEAELKAIVDAADSWFEEYKPFLDGDNRRNTSRSCLSIVKLRKIVQEESSIHANLGNSASKIARILLQAEEWYEEYQSLLVRCNLEPSSSHLSNSNVDLSEMKKAVEFAASDISLDLEEAVELKLLLEKVEHWFDRVAIIAPMRSKRQSKVTRSTFNMDDLLSLIEESSTLPLDVQEEVKRLEVQLSTVEAWRVRASKELLQIGLGFVELQKSINTVYGDPSNFQVDSFSKEKEEDKEDGTDSYEYQSNKALSDPMEIELNSQTHEENDFRVDMATPNEEDKSDKSITEKGHSNVQRMIRDLQSSAKGNGVITTEAEIADLLESVSRWCISSLKYLSSPREIFDKRFYGAFDRFIAEGERLFGQYEDQKKKALETTYEGLAENWSRMVSDQLRRLDILRAEREKFIKWCELANQVLADEKKLTAEKLEDLAEKSRCFPAVSDLVHKVRGLSVKVTLWVEETRKLYQSGRKLSMQDARSLVEAGEKLKVNTQELRTLKAALRTAKGWANRVKRCNVEMGETHVNTVNDLIKEYESFLIEMPEELSKLEQATQSYCICRRPYEGFMIGCDECAEWYHGSCIGVSESRAGRFDQYICVRCTVKNGFKSSALGAVEIIKKWTSRKGLKKARQVEYQKHQRKVRKETKDIEKLELIIKGLQEKLVNKEKPQETVGGGDTMIMNDGSNTILKQDGSENITEEHVEVNAENKNAPKHPDSGIADGVANSGASAGDEEVGLTSTDALKEDIPKMNKEVEEMPKDSDTEKVSTISDVVADIEKAKLEIQQAKERLELLSQKNLERKALEKREDENSKSLRRWCIRVRSLVLIPSSKEVAEEACPLESGALSKPMISVLSESESLGISDLPDIGAMGNLFQCMAWSLFTLSIIRRKPTYHEMKALLAEASRISLPNEKALKTLKHLYQKASQLRGKVKKALAPRPGETKNISMSLLRELSTGVETISVFIPESSKLDAAINDKGARYCFCGGPNDGNFMLSCGKCLMWFHGRCMNISSEANIDTKEWICPGCSGQDLSQPSLEKEDDMDVENVDQLYNFRNLNPSANAPDPSKVWPPFSLFGSSEATEVLGSECSIIPDDVGTLLLEQNATTVEVEETPSVPVDAKVELKPSPTPETSLSSHTQQEMLHTKDDGDVATENNQSSASTARMEEKESATSLVAAVIDPIESQVSNSEAEKEQGENSLADEKPDTSNINEEATDAPVSDNMDIDGISNDKDNSTIKVEETQVTKSLTNAERPLPPESGASISGDMEEELVEEELVPEDHGSSDARIPPETDQASTKL